jgi:hypothetical protein
MFFELRPMPLVNNLFVVRASTYFHPTLHFINKQANQEAQRI